MIPLVVGLVGADGRDMSLSLDDGRPVVRGVLTLTQPAQTFTFTGRRRAAGAVAQSRLLGADQGRRRTSRPTISNSSPRTTAIRSIAGRRCSRSPTRCWSRMSRRSAPGGTPREDDGLIAALAAVLADPSLEPAFVALMLTHAERGGHRARHRPRCRSGCDLRGARARCARDRVAARSGAARDLSAHARTTGPYSPDAAERRAPRAEECVPRPARGRRRRRRSRLRHGNTIRPTNMTDRMAALGDARAACRAGTPGRDRRFLPALRRRPAHHRQMAGAAGADPGGRDARPRAGADAASGVLARQSQPRARADRRLRAGEPDPVQPPRRRRLSISSPKRCWRSTRRTRRSPRASPPRSAPGARSSRCGARAPRRRCGALRRRQICRATSPTSSRARSRRRLSRGTDLRVAENLDGIGGCMAPTINA